MKSKRVLLAMLAFVFAFAMPLSALDKKDEEDGLRVIGAMYKIEDGTVEFDV